LWEKPILNDEDSLKAGDKESEERAGKEEELMTKCG
jgi:hypothetical protein